MNLMGMKTDSPFVPIERRTMDQAIAELQEQIEVTKSLVGSDRVVIVETARGPRVEEKL